MFSVRCSNVPFRIRVRCARKRNEDEDSPHKFYTLVTHVAVDSFKGQKHCVFLTTVQCGVLVLVGNVAVYEC